MGLCMNKRFIAISALLAVLFAGRPLFSDVLTLKDGTTVEGVVIKQGDNYWVKTPGGESRQIPVASVATIAKGATTPATVTPPPVTPTTPAPPKVVPAPTDPTYAQAKRKADVVDNPAAAVAILQAFVDAAKPNDPDLAAAKADLEKWKKLADDGAQKVNGKWVGGEERRKLAQQVFKLCTEAFEDLAEDRTLKAQPKLQEALKLNPASYSANALLGYMAMMEHNSDEALRYFEIALKAQPEAPGVQVDEGVLLVQEKKQYERGIMMIYKAALTEDDLGIAQDLITALARSPDAVKNSAKMKPVVDAALLLAGKYHINPRLPGAEQRFVMLVPVPFEASGQQRDKRMAGVIWSGTGFLISADGLILTNRHVAKDAPKLKVMLTDGERWAKVIKIDDDQDLALLKVEPKAGEKLPFVQLAKTDGPADGAEIVVMGYPLIDRLGATIKITRGIVSSASARGECDVLVDAKVNPGNSGGPMLDRFGNVAAIVSMKSRSSEMEDSYGMGISAGRIRKFLSKNAVQPEAAAAGTASLTPEEIAAKVKPAAVCILAIQ